MSDAGECKRNIEIKAKLEDEKEFNEKVIIAQELTGQSKSDILHQHDVFFKVPIGRLKLRYEVSQGWVDMKHDILFIDERINNHMIITHCSSGKLLWLCSWIVEDNNSISNQSI